MGDRFYTMSASDDDVPDMPEEKTKAMAEGQKAKGNAAFGKGDNKTALRHYTMAINLDPSNAVYYSNRSACHAGLSDWSSCLEDSNKTIEVRPEWFKGYARLAYRTGAAAWKIQTKPSRFAPSGSRATPGWLIGLEQLPGRFKQNHRGSPRVVQGLHQAGFRLLGPENVEVRRGAVPKGRCLC